MHELQRADLVAAVDRTVSEHLGRRWVRYGFVDLNDRASHPCGIHRGDGFDVFVKHSASRDGAEQFDLECRGLRFLEWHGGARIPVPVGTGVVTAGDGALLLLEAAPEVSPSDRSPADWRAIGTALAEMHSHTGATFGLAGLDGFFGPLRQDNRPVASNRWLDFFRERRLEPFRALAAASGHLPAELHAPLDALTDRLPGLVGPEPIPTLLHGDAQQNNFLTSPAGQAVVIDASPFYGHPENDLAMLDIFAPVPDDVFDAYRERHPLDAGFAGRRELWRVPVYLAAIAVSGATPFGRSFIPRLENALAGLG